MLCRADSPIDIAPAAITSPRNFANSSTPASNPTSASSFGAGPDSSRLPTVCTKPNTAIMSGVWTRRSRCCSAGPSMSPEGGVDASDCRRFTSRP